MDISIVILNYKSKGFTLNCIKSIKEADFGGLKYEIIVVDNNSDDNIKDILNWQYPEAKFIQNRSNLGMGAGNNVGLKQAQGDYLVVMNPDTIAMPDTFLLLHQYMQAHPRAGVVGPQQLNPDQSIQNSCFREYKMLTPVYRRTPLGGLPIAKKDIDLFLMKDFDHKSEREVPWLLGSFLFLRRAALEQAGFFDERYFMYFEDADLCRSLRQKGWAVVYFPAARIIHNHLRQSAQIAWYKFFTNRMTRYHIASWLKYKRKWKIVSK